MDWNLEKDVENSIECQTTKFWCLINYTDEILNILGYI